MVPRILGPRQNSAHDSMNALSCQLFLRDHNFITPKLGFVAASAISWRGTLEEASGRSLFSGNVGPLAVRTGVVERGFAAQHEANFSFLLFDMLDGESWVSAEELGELLLLNVDGELFIQ
jgi:hypothetical protein